MYIKKLSSNHTTFSRTQHDKWHNHVFFKKIYFKLFFMFLDYFDMLMLKIIFFIF